MFSAVHSDRSGRVVVSHDRSAAAFDGARNVALAAAVLLPDDAELVPLDREALGLDRVGRVVGLGRSRWAVGALPPDGTVRALHPSYAEDDTADTPLAPRALAAVCADDRGRLHAAVLTTPCAAPRPVTATVPVTPRGDVVSRQLSRCAHDNRCAGAVAALARTGTAALPVGAEPNERPPAWVALHPRADATPRERAVFHPNARELAEHAAAHFAAGGLRVSFGRACEGEPLLALALITEALTLIHGLRADALTHLETNGSSAAGLRRLAAAGLREVTVRLASARAETYELIHGPIGYRFQDVRATVHAAHQLGLRLTLAILVLPGLTDLGRELEALGELADEAPGATIELRDLAADAHRAATAPRTRGDAPLGIPAVLARLRAA